MLFLPFSHYARLPLTISVSTLGYEEEGRLNRSEKVWQLPDHHLSSEVYRQPVNTIGEDPKEGTSPDRRPCENGGLWVAYCSRAGSAQHWVIIVGVPLAVHL